MSAAFTLPFIGRCVMPQPEPKPARFERGARVVFLSDRDEGEVTGLIPGQAVSIRWDSSNRIEWYPLFSVAARERIVVLEEGRGIQ